MFYMKISHLAACFHNSTSNQVVFTTIEQGVELEKYGFYRIDDHDAIMKIVDSSTSTVIDSAVKVSFADA